MNYDFALILMCAAAATGLICLLDIVYLAPRRKVALAMGKLSPEKASKYPWIIEYARSFFPVLIIVLVIRSFIIQPWRVPTGSLEPTVLPGDFILVNQFTYGLRLPVANKKFLSIGKPKVGDIAVFRWPVNPKIDYVKRVIGTPGDHIAYKDKILYINGVQAAQTDITPGVDIEPTGNIAVEKRTEVLNGVEHKILVNPSYNRYEEFDIVVPEGQYFMMGDNRDNSGDSRYWGYVPESHLIGKAMVVWLSWDSNKHWFRWQRIGTVL